MYEKWSKLNFLTFISSIVKSMAITYNKSLILLFFGPPTPTKLVYSTGV